MALVGSAGPFTQPKPLSSWLRWEVDPRFTRRTKTLLAGSGAVRTVLSAALVGLVSVGAVTVAAKSGGNTGNGVLTLDVTTPKLVNSQTGVYQVRNIGEAYDGAIAAVAGNTGNGTAAMNSTETATGVVEGVYKAVFLEPATDLGRFVVEDPAGVVIGQGIVGTLFDGVVKFTISDGATDFGAGDTFTITVVKVTATNGGLFSVTDPSGNVLGTYATGAAAFATEVKFTIADGATDFIVGDGFDITVAAGSSKYVGWSPSAIDGSAVVKGIAIYDAEAAASVDNEVVVLEEGPALVNTDELAWPAGISADDKAAAILALAALGIKATVGAG